MARAIALGLALSGCSGGDDGATTNAVGSVYAGPPPDTYEPSTMSASTSGDGTSTTTETTGATTSATTGTTGTTGTGTTGTTGGTTGETTGETTEATGTGGAAPTEEGRGTRRADILRR